MQYPLQESIGNPDLFVGRAREFDNFGKWIANIPGRLSRSRVILARRKSGKTAFVQRVFNQLWNENGAVIPFFFSVKEEKVWYPDFAIQYFRAFASQVISFLERDEILVSKWLSLETIREYGVSKSLEFLVSTVDDLRDNQKMGFYGQVWDAASYAPHRFADLYDRRVLVILDEFQYLAKYIYRDEACQDALDETMPGSYHSLSESKIAPMLVTGSYISWLIEISNKYLEAGRLHEWYMSPYLTEEEGLQAVYKYAEVYHEPITNETAILFNQLCMSDPFFISCVVQSTFEGRDLTTADGVIRTVEYEITDRRSHLSKTWAEYIGITLSKINDRHAKRLLLFLSKHADRYWTPRELKAELRLDLELDDIQHRLLLLVEADVLEWGPSDIQFLGLQDGTLNLVLRNRFEQEINNFIPDLQHEFHEQVAQLRKENKRLQGMLNNLSGKVAEIQLATAFRAKKRFTLSSFFEGVQDATRLNLTNVRVRVPLQREDGKQMELDVVAESSCGRVAVVEVKKWKEPIGTQIVEDFCEKLTVYAEQHPENTILPAILALGGFTPEAQRDCEEQGIATAERITHF